MKLLLCILCWFTVFPVIEAGEVGLSISGDTEFEEFSNKIKNDILHNRSAEIHITINKSKNKTFTFNYQTPSFDGHKKNPWHSAYFKIHEKNNEAISGKHILNDFSIYFFDVDSNDISVVIKKLEKISDSFKKTKNTKFCVALRINNNIKMKIVAETIEYIEPFCGNRFILEKAAEE